jgi:hypothetical protein
MSRSLSTAAANALTGSETTEVFLILLTIDHDDLVAPIRVVNDNANITSRSNLYVAFPFDIILPADSAENLSRISLKIDNIDRQIVDAIRSITTPPTVTIEVILASSPDTLEAGPFDMTMEHAEYDANFVICQLAFEDVLNEPFPGGRFLPSGFEGLF